jgi:hypothetical protein
MPHPGLRGRHGDDPSPHPVDVGEAPLLVAKSLLDEGLESTASKLDRVVDR